MRNEPKYNIKFTILVSFFATWKSSTRQIETRRVGVVSTGAHHLARVHAAKLAIARRDPHSQSEGEGQGRGAAEGAESERARRSSANV